MNIWYIVFRPTVRPDFSVEIKPLEKPIINSGTANMTSTISYSSEGGKTKASAAESISAFFHDQDVRQAIERSKTNKTEIIAKNQLCKL